MRIGNKKEYHTLVQFPNGKYGVQRTRVEFFKKTVDYASMHHSCYWSKPEDVALFCTAPTKAMAEARFYELTITTNVKEA